MFLSSISNRKVHCCLVMLILFILIFLSLPLLLIFLANSRYEERQSLQEKTPGRHSSISPNGILIPISPPSSLGGPANGGELGADIEPINCTKHALDNSLTLLGDSVQCPDGYFPCSSCPDICVEQRRNCNGVADCPDRSDESSCHDSSGAISIIFQNIVNVAARKNKNVSSATGLAKPDSCTLDEFVHEQCPCVYTDAHVIICENLGLAHVPNSFLSSVYKIRMGNNSIKSIDSVAWPRSLASLVLVNNQITHIGRSAFENAPNLSKLYLSHNEINYIDSEAFSGLSSLTSLQMESNNLELFDAQMLRHTPVIAKIYLSENKIDLPEDTRFEHCRYLRELLLDHNRISIIKAGWFSNMSSLIWLSLTHNQISVIEDGAFNWDYQLEELNLSFNKIKVINRQTFQYSLNIQRLFLAGNPLEPLSSDAFREVVQLRSLNLTHVDFDYINTGTFSYLTQLEFIYFAKFRYCHYANHVRVCRPLTDGLSSIEALLAFPTLKYAVWIVALVCSIGNVFVFIWRSVSRHEDRTLSLFVKNLSIADLMMGIYLGTIGWQDWKFQNKFGRFAIEWISSWQCTAIGFLAILSSELSVFILTIITIERYRSIMSIRRFEVEAQKRRARIYVTLAWFLSFLIAAYPLVGWYSRQSDYYATNGLCLPLHIDQPFTRGWQYSAFIYLGINFSAVIIIIALYIHMYTIIIDGRQMTRPVLFKGEKREDAILAIRFFFIVVTDCLCWIPIVVIKIMALANVSISSSIYGWLVVFIIPINSALNPIIYTLAAPTSLRDSVCRIFERLCSKMDALTSGGGSNYSSHSSTASSSGGGGNSVAHLIGRRRGKPGSNSTTTCDTFDTSFASHSKASVESTLLHQNQTNFCSATAAAAADLQYDLGNPTKSTSSSPSAAGDARSEQFNLDANSDKFYPSYNTGTIGTCPPSSKGPYDCLSTYDSNSIKHTIIVNHTSIPNERKYDAHISIEPYDTLKRRFSENFHNISNVNKFGNCDCEQYHERLDCVISDSGNGRTDETFGCANLGTSVAETCDNNIANGMLDSNVHGQSGDILGVAGDDDLHCSFGANEKSLGDSETMETRCLVNTGRRNRVSFSSDSIQSCLQSQTDLN